MEKSESLTPRQLYKLKNTWMRDRFLEVSAIEFYRDVFPKGSFERVGHPEDEKPNGIMTVIEGDKARNYLVFDDLEEVKLSKGKEFAILSPIGYKGRNRTAKNARWLYGVGIDLDGVGMQQLRDLFYQMEKGVLPQCSYCINSGNGLHVYYLFEKPLPLYYHLHDRLRAFKYELIAKVWNRYTSTYTERDQVQYQGIFQGFRIIGSKSKLGARYPVRGFRTGGRVTLEYLNGFLMDKSKAVHTLEYMPKMSLKEAKERYPEWYQRRVVEKKERGRWHVKRDLYDWWLRKIREGASAGHRYFCLTVLATYAVKCDIDEDELGEHGEEAETIAGFLLDIKGTKQDALDAMKLYQESYVTYSRAEAERVSAIPMPPNKRNGRKRDAHLILARGIREIKRGMGEKVSGGGRPVQAQKVAEWREIHPDGKKVECARDTGLSRPTVYRWWNA